jgi:hypothetical protein
VKKAPIRSAWANRGNVQRVISNPLAAYVRPAIAVNPKRETRWSIVCSLSATRYVRQWANLLAGSTDKQKAGAVMDTELKNILRESAELIAKTQEVRSRTRELIAIARKLCDQAQARSRLAPTSWLVIGLGRFHPVRRLTLIANLDCQQQFSGAFNQLVTAHYCIVCSLDECTHNWVNVGGNVHWLLKRSLSSRLACPLSCL